MEIWPLKFTIDSFPVDAIRQHNLSRDQILAASTLKMIYFLVEHSGSKPTTCLALAPKITKWLTRGTRTLSPYHLKFIVKCHYEYQMLATMHAMVSIWGDREIPKPAIIELLGAKLLITEELLMGQVGMGVELKPDDEVTNIFTVRRELLIPNDLSGGVTKPHMKLLHRINQFGPLF